MSLENILHSAKKTAVSALTGITLLGSSMFYSPQVKAGDIIETKTISLVTSLDSDGDGLTNEYETSIGSNPDLFDTDGDEFEDGEEIGYNNVVSDPLNPDSPGFGSANTVHKMRSIQNLTSGLDNVVASTWLVGGKIAYIEGDSLYVKNLFNLSEPRELLVSGLNNKFIEISSGSLGDSVYFHVNDGEKDVINKVNINTKEISKVVPSDLGNVPYGVRNPSVSGKVKINIDEAKLVLDGSQWLVAESDLPDITRGQVYLFKLVNDETNPNFGVWDGSTPVKLTNSLHKIIRPKISKDGDKLMFQDMINDGSSTLYLYNGVTGIVNNKKTPYNPEIFTDLRGGNLVSSWDGFAFSGGFGRGFAYWTVDKNKTYSFDRNNLNDANFDINFATYGITPNDRFGTTSTKKSIVLPNNQLGISISPEGGRVAFLDNYLEESEGNYNLYGAATKGSFKIVQGLEAEYLNGYKDSSGISLEENYPEHQLITGGNTLFSISMLFNPISDASSSEYFSGLREFEPSGLEVIGPGPTVKPYHPAGVYIKLPWDDNELVTPEGVLDESTIVPAWQVEGATSEYATLPESQIVERNLDQNYIKFYIDHFSRGGFKAKLLEKVSAVNDWMYMEQPNVNDYKIDTSTEEYKPYVLELKPWKP